MYCMSLFVRCALQEETNLLYYMVTLYCMLYINEHYFFVLWFGAKYQ